MDVIRIGCGAGFGEDRLDPALTLLERGGLDYIGFECLAERTIALAQKQKLADPAKGYNDLLEYRMESVLPIAHAKGVKVITNMGAANPMAALEVVVETAVRMNLKGMKIAAVLGDDITGSIDRYLDQPMLETGARLGSVTDSVLSANAYLGAAPIVEALRGGADVIITGRVADPALFLAPLVHEFGWSLRDFDKLGRGTLVGHLLECAGQLTGGYYADPGKKEVPEMWNLGFPFVDVDASGSAVVSKVEGTGGIVNTATCTEQLLYEIHDPARYVTPDCVADFSGVVFEEVGKNRVSARGATGSRATDSYKVSVGYRNGYFGVGEISYGGPNAVARARLAAEIVRKRIESLGPQAEDLRCELIGMDSIAPFEIRSPGRNEPGEVRLRVAGRTKTEDQARQIANEVQALYTNGPAGGGGAAKHVSEVVSVVSILVPKSDVEPEIEYREVSRS